MLVVTINIVDAYLILLFVVTMRIHESVHSGCTSVADSTGADVKSRKQEAFGSVSKNTNVDLESSYAWL